MCPIRDFVLAAYTARTRLHPHITDSASSTETLYVPGMCHLVSLYYVDILKSMSLNQCT